MQYACSLFNSKLTLASATRLALVQNRPHRCWASGYITARRPEVGLGRSRLRDFEKFYLSRSLPFFVFCFFFIFITENSRAEEATDLVDHRLIFSTRATRYARFWKFVAETRALVRGARSPFPCFYGFYMYICIYFCVYMYIYTYITSGHVLDQIKYKWVSTYT